MRFAVVALVSCTLLGLAAPAANASSGIRFGVQDDAWLTHGGGTIEDRLDRLQALGVDIVRFNLHWDRIERARGKPNWSEPDLVLNGLRSRGIPAVVGLVGSPRWANGGRTPNFAPGAASFARFARAAATRYRWVTRWLVWNEPNQRRWLRPTTAATYVRQLLNPAYRAIHAANRRALVGGGVTAPRAASGGVSPVVFIRGMRAAGARLDAYAHHPYPSSPGETPYSGGCAHCTTITMATLERLLAEVGRAFGTRKRIWLTEYGYQTGSFGVTQQRQAELLGESARRAHQAPRVDILIHYLVKDEPASQRFQSGLYTARDRPKRAALAFPLPLAQAGRSGGKLVLWGQVRPRTGRQAYTIQVQRSGGWQDVGGTRRTGSRGFFSVQVAVPPGALVRVHSPEDDAFSASIRAR